MGVRVLFADANQWEICGEAKDGPEAIQKAQELSPDLVILDLSMPVMGGVEAARRIRQVAPSTRIVFLSMHETPSTARLVGADAFVSKSCAAQDLAKTIYSVLGIASSPARS
jgi:DNA-binding NarL/FixJ family response regulator